MCKRVRKIERVHNREGERKNEKEKCERENVKDEIVKKEKRRERERKEKKSIMERKSEREKKWVIEKETMADERVEWCEK